MQKALSLPQERTWTGGGWTGDLARWSQCAIKVIPAAKEWVGFTRTEQKSPRRQQALRDGEILDSVGHPEMWLGAEMGVQGCW